MSFQHAHTIGTWNANNTLYLGEGNVFTKPDPELRLTQEGGPLSIWRVPAWLKDCGLTYHRKPDRWLPDNRLKSVARGQEFVCDIGNRQDAREWLDHVIANGKNA